MDVYTSTSYTPTYSSSYVPTFSSETTAYHRPRGYPKPLGRGNGFPLVYNGRFLLPSYTQLVIQRRRSSAASSYSVSNGNGYKLFYINYKFSTFQQVKTLTERASGVPLLQMRDKMFSFRSTVFICDAHERTLLVLQKASVINMGSPVIYGYIRMKSHTTPDLIITARSSGRKFVMRDRRSNEIARITRSSSRSRSSSNGRSYRLSINPGYDVALFSLCAVYLAEAWNA